MIVGLIDFSKEDLSKLGYEGRDALIDAVASGNHEEIERIYHTLHPLTRFEYMQSCTMEELVELLQDIMHVCRGCTADCALVCHHYKTDKVVLCCGDGIKDWLQEEYHADKKQ